MADTPRQTPPQLGVETTVGAADLLLSWRDPGPLKSLQASVLSDFMSGSITYTASFANAVTRPLREKLEDEVSIKDFLNDDGLPITGEFDVVNTAVQTALDLGTKLYWPEGDYVIDQEIDYNPVPLIDVDPPNPSAVGAFAGGPHWVGAGMIYTRIHNRVVGGTMLKMNVTNPTPYAYRAEMGGRFECFAVIGGGAYANSSGFELLNGYQFQFRQVHIRNLSGTAIKLINGAFADDGWNSVQFDGLWIEGCQEWAMDATGTAGRNEGSFTHMKHVFIQGCGKNQYFHITGVTNASPAVVTVSMLQVPTRTPQQTTHGFVEGDRIRLFGVKQSLTLGADPLATTINTKKVIVTATAHGLQVGDIVILSGAAAVGGITPTGEYQIAAVTTNTYTINHTSAATSTATGGGASVVQVANWTRINEVTLQVGPSPTSTTFSLYTDAGVPVAINTSTDGALYNPLSPVALGVDPFITTNGSPVVTVNHVAYGAASTDTVTFSGAVAVNGLTLNGEYRITAISGNPDQYQITASSNASGSGSGGGGSVTATYYKQAGVGVPEVGYYEPQTGGMRWKGQLLHMDQCGFTINQNCAFYVKGQSGLGIGVHTEGVTWENNYRRHVFCTGITNWRSEVCQFHGNQSYKQWAGADFDGTDFSIRGVEWVNTKIRARNGEGYAFRVAGTNAEVNTIRFRRNTWDDFDYVGQKRFVGVQFDAVTPATCIIRNAGATAVTLGPPTINSTGNKMPLKLRGPNNAITGGQSSFTGEIVEWRIPQTGVTLSNASLDDEGLAIAINTQYNVYLYDNDGTAALVASTVAPTADTGNGYQVKDSDPTKIWVGQVRTETGTTNWLTTSTQFLSPNAFLATNQGVYDWFWWDPTSGGRMQRKAGTKPTSTSNGTEQLRPIFEASTTTDLGSIPSGQSVEFTIAATGVATRDGVLAVSSSLNNSLVLSGRVSAADTITVNAFNPNLNGAGAAIDPANATYTAFYVRR